MKTFDAYQAEARRTMTPQDPRSSKESLAVMALGLAGEAGEVADLVKKYLGHGRQLQTAEVVKELGDVLWYVTAVAELFGVDLEHIAIENIEKLRKRHPNGFSHATANAKADEPAVQAHADGSAPPPQ